MGMVFRTPEERDQYVKSTFYAPSKPVSEKNNDSDQGNDQDAQSR